MILCECFNSRPHEEVDINVNGSATFSRRFNSRPHEEVDQKLRTLNFQLFRFNSRPHEEVDGSSLQNIQMHRSFNSRPHEEVDDIRQSVYYIHQQVSTHDLTKRSTAIFTQKVFLSKSLFVLIAYNIFILH